MFTKEDLYGIIEKKGIFGEMHTTLAVVDDQLRIVYINGTFIPKAKDCPGDVLMCHNALSCEGGCGSHPNCSMCSLRGTVSKSLRLHKKLESDVSLLVRKNDEFDMHVISEPFEIEGKQYSIVLLVDQTEKKRQFMMERIFFHDVLNISGGINGILDCVEEGDENMYDMIKIVKNLAKDLTDVIMSQRDLVYAQKGLLKPEKHSVNAQTELVYTHSRAAEIISDKYRSTLILDSTLTNEKINVDNTLLHRCLDNMLKNACEACKRGGTIRLKARPTKDTVIFSVHNDAVIPDNIKSNIFIQGNSSKGKGRGLGTYSMKLIGENYLNGKVWFTSEEGQGTEFFLEIHTIKS